MIDSGHGDKTAGREGGLLKIRYANRNKNHTFSIYFKQCCAVLVHSRRTFQVRNAAALAAGPESFRGSRLLLSSAVPSFLFLQKLIDVFLVDHFHRKEDRFGRGVGIFNSLVVHEFRRDLDAFLALTVRVLADRCGPSRRS